MKWRREFRFYLVFFFFLFFLMTLTAISHSITVIIKKNFKKKKVSSQTVCLKHLKNHLFTAYCSRAL